MARLFAWSVCRVALLLPAGLGAHWAIVDPERRTLYDRAAGLWLVRARLGRDAKADPANGISGGDTAGA
jgi:uncharacterized RDD family membrane protein YckC